MSKSSDVGLHQLASDPDPAGRGAAGSIVDGENAVLRWTACIGAVTAESLACLQGTSLTTAARRLALATREKQLSRRHLLVGQPALYTVTAAGMRCSGVRGLKPMHVSVANAPHAIACAQAAAALQRRYADHRITGERELRRDERSAGRPIASAKLTQAHGDRSKLHRPDLVLWPPASAVDVRPIAIEIEIAVKAPRRLAEICRAWGRSREVAGVVYFASESARAALQRAIEIAHAEERIAVLALDALSPPAR